MKPQPKTVRAWAFGVLRKDKPIPYIMDVWDTRNDARRRRLFVRSIGYAVGPVVRIEVPAPKERKR